MRTRVISLLLAFLLVFGGIVPVSAADSAESALGYVDVPEGAWFNDAVAYMTAEGYMVGMSEDYFRPEGELTRGQFVTILHRLDGTPAVAYSDRFSDVPDNKWYTTAILWAEENGIVRGYGNGIFGVDDLITREQMVVMMHRFVSEYRGLKMEGEAELSAFSDEEQVSGYARDAVKWAVFNGLIQGSAGSDGVKLLPRASATRAQCAAIIQRFMDKLNSITPPGKEDELPMIPLN